MANIAKLNVLLTANAGAFVRGINTAKKKVTGFQTSIAGLSSFMSRNLTRGFFAATAAITATATAITYLTKKSGDMVDTNAKAARRLGMTYNELTALNYAAGLAGVSSDKLTTALEKMADTLGAAQFGESAAVRAFEQIGLSVEQLSRLSPERQFRAIANAISQIEDPSQRIAAARDIFGRGGAGILNVLEGGAAAIDDATQKIQTFGLALSSLQTDAIEYMNDRFSDIATIIEGIGVQISAYVAPYMGQILDDTINWVTELGGVPAIMDTVFMKLASGMDYAMKVTDNIRAAWILISEKVSSIWNSIPESFRSFITMNPVRDYFLGRSPESQGGGFPARVSEKAAQLEAQRGGSFSSAYDNFRNRVSNRMQDAENAPAVEEARRRRQMEQYDSYVRRFGPPQQMATEAETMQLLRQIAQNTGRNNLAFAG